MSSEAYHKMAQLYEAMPRHYQLKQCIAELNMPNGTCKVQLSLKQ